MPVQDAIRDAEYGLQMTKENLEEEHLQYHLKAFLMNLKSVFDYLLEDYNVKYGLGISDSDDLSPATFLKRAKSLGNAKAKAFIDWFTSCKTQLESDGKFSFLMSRHGRRDIAVHRRSISLTVHKTITGKATITKSDLERSTPATVPVIWNKGVSTEYYISGFKNESLVTVCEHCLDMITRFASECPTKF